MIRRPIPLWLYSLLVLAGFATLLAIYAMLSARMTASNPQQTIMPGWSGFVAGLQRVLKPNGFDENPKPALLWIDLAATYWRLLVGMGLGVALSIIVGIAMGSFRWIEAPLSPIITFLSKIPPTAMLPVYFLLVGHGQWLFTAMVGLGVFFTMSQAIYSVVQKDVSQDAIDKAYTLGASEFEVIFEIIWMQILPRVIDNVRLQIGPAMIFLLAAEWIVADVGMGYRIKMESKILNMSVIYIYLAILGASGLLLERALLSLRRRVSPWFGD